MEEENRASAMHEHWYQIMTLPASLLHISIMLATNAIVMRGRRWQIVQLSA